MRRHRASVVLLATSIAMALGPAAAQAQRAEISQQLISDAGFPSLVVNPCPTAASER